MSNSVENVVYTLQSLGIPPATQNQTGSAIKVGSLHAGRRQPLQPGGNESTVPMSTDEYMNQEASGEEMRFWLSGSDLYEAEENVLVNVNVPIWTMS